MKKQQMNDFFDVEKTYFFKGGSCTLCPNMGWGEDWFEYIMCGMAKDKKIRAFWFWTSMFGIAKGLKLLAFLEVFQEQQNHKEKFILWGRNWIHWKDNFLKVFF